MSILKKYINTKEIIIIISNLNLNLYPKDNYNIKS